MKQTELRNFLEQRVFLYNKPAFIETDPIQVPHQFQKKHDIEISAFLSASIAWGLRKTIIKNAKFMMQLMDNAPADFVLNFTDNDYQKVSKFVHRTFNSFDLQTFLYCLKNIYKNHQGLEKVFSQGYLLDNTVKSSLIHFYKIFFAIKDIDHRSKKHISDVSKKSAAKRLNMFLMWMVRNDACGVHFGIWKNIPASALMLPLDVHTSNVGRALGLLTRTQNDWQAVEEITANLRFFDPDDPVKYDFALFGAGVFEKIK